MNKRLLLSVMLFLFSVSVPAVDVSLDFADQRPEFYAFEVKDLIIKYSNDLNEFVPFTELLIESEKTFFVLSQETALKKQVVQLNGIGPLETKTKLIKIIALPELSLDNQSGVSAVPDLIIARFFDSGAEKISIIKAGVIAPKMSFNAKLEKASVGKDGDNSLLIDFKNESSSEIKDIKLLLRHDAETYFQPDFFEFSNLAQGQGLFDKIPFRVPAFTTKDKKITLILNYVDSDGLHELRQELGFSMGGIAGLDFDLNLDFKSMVLIAILIIGAFAIWTFFRVKKQGESHPPSSSPPVQSKELLDDELSDEGEGESSG